MKTHHLSWALALMLLASSASATTFTVTTTADEFDTPSGADVSLREAIRDAGNAAGADTIVFNGALSGQTITLGGTELLVNHSLSIDASSLTTGITISGNNISRGFRVNSPGVLSL
ncbi:MAG: hypothetical protein ABL974_14320, partial [Prosthecobacter sp.]